MGKGSSLQHDFTKAVGTAVLPPSVRQETGQTSISNCPTIASVNTNQFFQLSNYCLSKYKNDICQLTPVPKSYFWTSLNLTQKIEKVYPRSNFCLLTSLQNIRDSLVSKVKK